MEGIGTGGRWARVAALFPSGEREKEWDVDSVLTVRLSTRQFHVTGLSLSILLNGRFKPFDRTKVFGAINLGILRNTQWNDRDACPCKLES